MIPILIIFNVARYQMHVSSLLKTTEERARKGSAVTQLDQSNALSSIKTDLLPHVWYSLSIDAGRGWSQLGGNISTVNSPFKQQDAVLETRCKRKAMSMIMEVVLQSDIYDPSGNTVKESKFMCLLH